LIAIVFWVCISWRSSTGLPAFLVQQSKMGKMHQNGHKNGNELYQNYTKNTKWPRMTPKKFHPNAFENASKVAFMV
jgi:hypothetical protein